MRKLENQKEIIFNVAKEILSGEDNDKFSVRMISRKCNIGMGTIYKYYGNKDDIILDITRELWMSYIKEVKYSKVEFTSFIDYTQYLFNKLEVYSKEFNYEILSKQLSTTFRETGKSHHNKAQSHFISLISTALRNHYIIDEGKVMVYSTFIANNLIAMITNKDFKYETFEITLTDLLTQYKERT